MSTQLPQYFLSHSSVSVAVETYRVFLSTAGRFPCSPFPTPYYLDLLQRYTDLLIHVLHNSPCYPPVTVSMDSGEVSSSEISSEQQGQVPETYCYCCFFEMSCLRLEVLVRCWRLANWHMRLIMK